MKKSALILAVFFSGMLACQTPPVPATSKEPAKDSNAAGAAGRDSSAVPNTAAKPDLRSLHLSFANPKDPSCGMPLTAGLEDTVRYKGKLYGFCSKECKDAFLKDPEDSLSALK